MRTTFLLLILLSYCPANATAQDSDANPASTARVPVGPLPSPAPDFSQWTITFSYPDEKKANDAASNAATSNFLAYRTRTITTTKTGNIIHEETTAINGGKTDAWQANGNYYVKRPGRTNWSAYEKTDVSQAGGQLRQAVLLPANGFRGLDWINSQNYAGTAQTKWGNCLIFVPGGRDTLQGDLSQEKLDSLSTVACLDAKTHLPVMVQNHDGTQIFQFASLSSQTMQALPDDLVAAIKAAAAMRVQREAAPRKEY